MVRSFSLLLLLTGIPLLAADYTLEIGNRSVPIREGQTVTLPNPGGSQLQITLKPAADASGMRTYSANGITFQYPATVRPQEVDLASGQAKLIKLTDLTMFQVLPKLDAANRKGFIDGTLKGFKTTFPGKVSDRLYPASLTLGGKKWTGSYFKATLDNQEFRFNSYLIAHGDHTYALMLLELSGQAGPDAALVKQLRDTFRFLE